MTTKAQIRATFWRDHQGIKGITRKKITDHSGIGKMHNTDTRCAFVDYVDRLSNSNTISKELADSVTL